jgi:hypothetical protein
MTETEHKICNKCEHLQPIENYTKEKKPDGSYYFRKKCKRCRNKQRRDNQKETNYWSKRYQSMSEEDRKAYIKKKSLQNQERFKTNPEALKNKKKYEKSDKGIYNRYRNECNRRGRLKRGIKVLIEFDDFQKLINDKCYYCNKDNCRGVDRVCADGNYELNNVKSCCNICNQMKNNMTHDDFLDHIDQILLTMRLSS